jgi:hypothetical protein
MKLRTEFLKKDIDTSTGHVRECVDVRIPVFLCDKALLRLPIVGGSR